MLSPSHRHRICIWEASGAGFAAFQVSTVGHYFEIGETWRDREKAPVGLSGTKDKPCLQPRAKQGKALYVTWSPT